MFCIYCSEAETSNCEKASKPSINFVPSNMDSIALSEIYGKHHMSCVSGNMTSNFLMKTCSGTDTRTCIADIQEEYNLTTAVYTLSVPKQLCSLGSHKMKGSAHTTYAVPATALQILLMLARYIPCTPSVLDNVV